MVCGRACLSFPTLSLPLYNYHAPFHTVSHFPPDFLIILLPDQQNNHTQRHYRLEPGKQFLFHYRLQNSPAHAYIHCSISSFILDNLHNICMQPFRNNRTSVSTQHKKPLDLVKSTKREVRCREKKGCELGNVL